MENNITVNVDKAEDRAKVDVTVSCDKSSESEKSIDTQSKPTSERKDDKGGNITLKVTLCNFWKQLLNAVFSFSTVLFVAAVVFAVVAIFICNETGSDSANLFGEIKMICLFSFIVLLLVLSVIVRLRTDDARWIKLTLKSSVLDSIKGKELTEENRKILMDIMEL